MKEVTATEARRHFGRLLDTAQTGPVRITRYGKAAAVLVSVERFERLGGGAWETLAATMDALGEEASARDLTRAKLDSLLATPESDRQ